MRRGRTWHWTKMRPFLARFSESVWSGHLPSWADFITTTPELKFLVPTGLFDYVVGSRKQRRRYVQVECLGGPQVDHQLELGRQLHRQVGGFLTFENAVCVDR